MKSLIQPYGVTPNGGRTSADINHAMDDAFENWKQIYDMVEELGGDVSALSKRMSLQIASLQPYLTNIKFATVEGNTDYLYLDAHNLSNGAVSLIDQNNSTAKVWNEYGVITSSMSSLPQNQFCVLDSNDVSWIPKTTRLFYASGETMTTDINVSYTEETDRKALARAFDGKGTTTWSMTPTVQEGSSGEHIWVKALLPKEYLYQVSANAIVIHPEPMFGAELQGVWFTNETGEHDLLGETILAPWDDYYPRPAVPELFLLPPSKIAEVKFHYYLPASVGTRDNRAFHIAHLGVYSLGLASQSAIQVNVSSLLGERELAPSGHIINPEADQTVSIPIEISTVDGKAHLVTFVVKTELDATPQGARIIKLKLN